MSIEIGRFRVNWHLAAEQDRALAAATFARLLDEILEPALEDAVTECARDDELVAIRSVDVPRIVVRTDADARAWAGQVSAAVAGTMGAGGSGVVRYRSRSAAVVDILRRVALADARLVWAWRALGLWPDSTAEPADVLLDLLAVEPGSIVPLLEATGSTLPAVLELLGSRRLARLSVLAWHAHGAAPVRPPDAWRPAGQGSAAVAATAAVSTSAAVAATASTALARFVVDRLLPAGPLASAPVSAVAIAALLVLHADPTAVRFGRGSAQVEALLAQMAREAPRTPDDATGGAVPNEPGRPASPQPVDDTGRAGDGGPDAAASVEDGGNVSGNVSGNVGGVATRWAGLLFCLHPLRPLLDPRTPAAAGHVEIGDALLDAVDRHGLAPLLYVLGTALGGRASGPAEDPLGPVDAALLTFCGLPPGSTPPDADRCHAAAPVAGPLADAVVAALRVRLGDRPLGAAPEAALLRAVLRRTGVVRCDPGWWQVDLRLDEVTTDLRAAGLDLNPDWLPALGGVVRFHYG